MFNIKAHPKIKTTKGELYAELSFEYKDIQ